MPKKVLGVRQRSNKFRNHLAIKSKSSCCIIWKKHNAEFSLQQPQTQRREVVLDHVLEIKYLKIV